MSAKLTAERQQGFYDEQAETMSREQIRAMHEGILGTLVGFCYENSSTYREKFEEAGITPKDVASLDDLAKIPVTRKHETQGLKFEGLMTVPYNQARRIFVSPGPQFYAYGPIPRGVNPLLKVYHSIGFRPGDIVINTLTYHLTPAGINFDESLGEFGCAVIPAGPGSTDLQVQILQQLDVSGSVISRIMISGTCMASATQHSKHGMSPSAEPYSWRTMHPYVSSSSVRSSSRSVSADVSAHSSENSSRGFMPISLALSAMIFRNDGVPT